MNTIYLTEELGDITIPMRKETCKKKLFATWVENLNSCVSLKNLPAIGLTFIKYKLKEKEAKNQGLPLGTGFSQSMASLATKKQLESLEKLANKSPALKKLTELPSILLGQDTKESPTVQMGKMKKKSKKSLKRKNRK